MNLYEIKLSEQQIDIIIQCLENTTVQVKSARIVLELIDSLIMQYEEKKTS